MMTLNEASLLAGGILSALALLCVFTEGDYLVIKLPSIRIEKTTDSD